MHDVALPPLQETGKRFGSSVLRGFERRTVASLKYDACRRSSTVLQTLQLMQVSLASCQCQHNVTFNEHALSPLDSLIHALVGS